MAVYQFRSKDGDIVERSFPMAKAPELGATIKVKGKVYRRILSRFQLSAAITEMCSLRPGKGGYPKRSSALPLWCDGADHVQEGREKGKPIIQTRQHEQELCARHGFTRDYHPDDIDSMPVDGPVPDGQAMEVDGQNMTVMTELPKEWGEPKKELAY